MLRFLGRGSAFCPDNNSAFFVDGTDLILLDLPMSSFHKLIGIGLKALGTDAEPIRHIYVLVTHTHSDHIGGIPMLAHYAYYMWDKLPVTVVAPDQTVAGDLRFFMDRLEGCDPEAYTIITADAFSRVKAVIPTEHTPQLSGRCFGYLLREGSQDIIYTGDTATLSPFIPYLDQAAALYTEVSTHRSPVHLYLEDVKAELIKVAEAGTPVYLMHLDDEVTVSEQIKNTPLQLAGLYESKENPRP